MRNANSKFRVCDNIVVHDYGSVDLKVVYSTLVDDVPELIELFEK